MKHVDDMSPIEILRRRKSQIDKYIKRMDRVGSKGNFYNGYVIQSRLFNSAISILENAEVKKLTDYERL